MARLSSADVQLFVVNDGRVAGSAARRWAVEFGLGPVGRLQVEDDYVGEVLPMLILTTKDKELVALPKACRVACAYRQCEISGGTEMYIPMRTPGMSP